MLRRGLTNDQKSIAAEIRVDEVRKLVSFFSTTAGEGGWRVAIIDTADDLNTNGANALLKVLEEPPPRSLVPDPVERAETASADHPLALPHAADEAVGR